MSTKIYSHSQAREAALRYRKQQHFRDYDNALYQYAKRNGILKDVCSHMQKKKYRYAEEDLVEEALCYSTRSAFQYGNPQVYNVVRLRGKDFLDKTCAHMKPMRTASNCLYIIKIVGDDINGKQVYKVGITNNKSNRNRIKSIANKIKRKVDTMFYSEVNNPELIERTLLKFGDKVNTYDCFGRTEFRAVSDIDMIDMLDIAESNVIVG